MVKLRLVSFKHGKDRLVFIIKKSDLLKKFLMDFLIQCGFKENLYIQYYDAEKINIRKFEDVEDNYANNKFDIDIIHTHRSVILLVRIKSNLISRLRKEELENLVIGAVMKHCDFKGVKKI